MTVWCLTGGKQKHAIEMDSGFKSRSLGFFFFFCHNELNFFKSASQMRLGVSGIQMLWFVFGFKV